MMDLRHLLDADLRSAGISESPARHGIGLGEAVDEDRPLLHSGQAGDGDMLFLVGEFGVDLVGHDIDVVFDDDLRDGLEIRPFHDGSGGIVGEGKDQNLGLVRDDFLKLGSCQTEFVLRLQVDDHGLCACKNGAGLVGNIAGLGNEDLVSGIAHGAQADIDGLGSAHGDNDLALGIVLKSLGPLHIMTDLRAQLHQTCVGGVMGLSFFQRIDTLVTDMPGRVKVRLAHTQGDGILHLADDIKELPDPGGLDIDYLVC